MRRMFRLGRALLDQAHWALVMILPARVLGWRPLRWLRAGEPMISAEVMAVMEAAAILEISEYDLLVLAYEERFGRSPARAEIDRVFVPYMLAGRAPNWAVGVAEEIIALYESDRLGESRFRVRARPPTTRDILIGLAQCVLLLVVLWIIFVMFDTYHPP